MSTYQYRIDGPHTHNVIRATAEEALEHAKSIVYLSPKDYAEMETSLREHNEAIWTYGFNCVHITRIEAP